MSGMVSTGPLDTRFHSPSAVRDVSVPTVLSLVSQLPSPELQDLRVLVLACGSGRVTLPLAAAGHRVLATDVSQEALEQLGRRLSDGALHGIQAGAIELARADMTAFSTQERFKAVCIPTPSMTLLNRCQQRQTLVQAAQCLAPGGSLIVATEHVALTESTTVTAQVGPGVTLTEEIDPAEGRRRTTLSWGRETHVRDLYLAPPSLLAAELGRLELATVFQRSVADPTLPRHSTVILGAVRRP